MQFVSQALTQFFVQHGRQIVISSPTWAALSDSFKVNSQVCNNVFNVFGGFDRLMDA